jgi:3-oxoadipate enol-lactonase
MDSITYAGKDGCPLHAVVLGEGPVLVLLHGGGPDHHSLVPMARGLADIGTVVLPDVRGYGRSVCADPACHTWDRYVSDVIALLDHLGIQQAALGGTGLGGTITLRTTCAHPDRIAAGVVISVEDIEDDEAKEAEIAFMDSFADRVRTQGIEAAWAPVLPDLVPVIGTLVRDAIPRSDPASIAAAAAIGHDRSFRSVDELAAITVPMLIVPGADQRHPAALAENVARILPAGRLAPVGLSGDLYTADDFARAVVPAIRDFLATALGSEAGGR